MTSQRTLRIEQLLLVWGRWSRSIARGEEPEHAGAIPLPLRRRYVPARERMDRTALRERRARDAGHDRDAG